MVPRPDGHLAGPPANPRSPPAGGQGTPGLHPGGATIVAESTTLPPPPLSGGLGHGGLPAWPQGVSSDDDESLRDDEKSGSTQYRPGQLPDDRPFARANRQMQRPTLTHARSKVQARPPANAPPPPEVVEELNTRAAKRRAIRPRALIGDALGSARGVGWRSPAIKRGPPKQAMAGDRRVRSVQATGALQTNWRIGLGGAAIVGGLALIAVGVAVATGGIGLVVGGVIVGGALLTGGAAGELIPAAMAGARQQKTNLTAALLSLEHDGVMFTPEEANRLADVTDAQWRTLLHVPRSQVADAAGRQMLREHLVLNVARHSYERAMAEKPSLARIMAAGGLREGPADLDSLRRSVEGPGGETLYGPYDWDLEQGVAEGFRSKLPTSFVPVPGSEGAMFSGQCLADVTRDINPLLIARDGRRVQMHDRISRFDDDATATRKLARTLADFVGDKNGDQAAVVKNLSTYLSQGPFLSMTLPTQWLFPVARDLGGDPMTSGASHMISSDRGATGLDVEESADGGSYVLSYRVQGGIRGITSTAQSGKLPAHGQEKVSVSIRVRREDLAVGNHRFEFVERPRHVLHMAMGPATPVRRLP